MNPNVPLRIAQLSPLWKRVPPSTSGGVELMLKWLIDELVARGHDVTLFGTGDCVTNAKLRAICEVNLCERFERGEGRAYEYYVNSLMAEVLLSAGEFDVIHAHLPLGWMPLGAASATPILWTLHSNIDRCEESALRHFPDAAVAGISHHQVQAASLALGRKFPVVYNGCDFDAYEYREDPGEYLVFLGRMSPERNPLAAIRIAGACELPIVLAGQPRSASDEKYFTEEIKPLIDGKQVRWIGSVNHFQRNELLKKAMALLFPIQWDEPFGLEMIEAMACGTPVVAHRRGSVAEVVDNGITGYHVSVIDGMAEMVPHALDLDRAEVRRHAASRFGIARMVDDYLAIYRRMIAARR